MTKEDKELLLKDISARLPYKVKVQLYNYEGDTKTVETLREIDSDCYISTLECDTLKNIFKPYLFPLSSMTEEQKKEYNLLKDFVPTYHYEYGDIIEDIELCDNLGSIDYLIANHFDLRELIPKGLALDATNLNIY